MRIKERDWSVLKRGVVPLAFAVLFATVISGISAYIFYQKKTVNDTLRKQVDRARTELANVQREEKIILQYKDKFESLVHRGVLGEERRLAWVESVQRTVDKLKFPVVQYRLRPQQTFNPEYWLGNATSTVRVSRMEINAQLLHENDFARLLRDLNQHAGGLYFVNECEFRRNAASVEMDPGLAHVMSQCYLDWFTVNYQSDHDEGAM